MHLRAELCQFRFGRPNKSQQVRDEVHVHTINIIHAFINMFATFTRLAAVLENKVHLFDLVRIEYDAFLALCRVRCFLVVWIRFVVELVLAHNPLC